MKVKYYVEENNIMIYGLILMILFAINSPLWVFIPWAFSVGYWLGNNSMVRTLKSRIDSKYEW